MKNNERIWSFHNFSIFLTLTFLGAFFRLGGLLLWLHYYCCCYYCCSSHAQPPSSPIYIYTPSYTLTIHAILAQTPIQKLSTSSRDSRPQNILSTFLARQYYWKKKSTTFSSLRFGSFIFKYLFNDNDPCNFFGCSENFIKYALLPDHTQSKSITQSTCLYFIYTCKHTDIHKPKERTLHTDAHTYNHV